MSRRSRRHARRWALLAVVLFAIAACGGSGSAGEAELASGGEVGDDVTASTDDAPDPTLLTGSFATVDGSQFDLGSLAGTDVVLWFWAPW